MSSENYEANGYKHKFGFSNHLALIAYFISYEKWMQREKCPNNTCLRYHIAEINGNISSWMIHFTLLIKTTKPLPDPELSHGTATFQNVAMFQK